LKGKKSLLALLGVLLMLGVILVTSIPALAAPVGILLKGSTTVYPIVNGSEIQFESDFPNIDLQYQGGGSGQGSVALFTEPAQCDIAMRSKVLESSYDINKVFETKIAWDGIAVIVNDGLSAYIHGSVTSITKVELYNIYQGNDIVYWDSLSGYTGTHGSLYPIIPRARITDSGTRSSFLSLIGSATEAGEELAVDATGLNRLESNDTMASAIAGMVESPAPTHEESQIGYCGLGFLTTPGITTIPVQNSSGTPIQCSQTTVGNGTYPLSRLLYLYTRHPDFDRTGGNTYKLEALDYVNWILSSEGQAIVVDEGYVKLPTNDAITAVTQTLYWDQNNNRACDIGDVVVVGRALGQSGWYPTNHKDANGNGAVDIGDVVVVGKRLGRSWIAPQ
jgi:phosphate transport system substrate-binding protein